MKKALFLTLVAVLSVGCAAGDPRLGSAPSGGLVATSDVTVVTTENDATAGSEDALELNIDTLTESEWRPLFDGMVVHKSFSSAVDISEIPSTESFLGERGQGANFVMADERHLPWGERSRHYYYEITSDEEFAPYLTVTNWYVEARTFVIIGIVDFQQASFTLDNLHGRRHEIVIPPKTKIDVPISMGYLSHGEHDVRVVVFPDPYRAYPYRAEDVLTVFSDPETLGDLFVYTVDAYALVIVDGIEEPAYSLAVDAFGSPPTPDGMRAGTAAFFGKPGSEHPTSKGAQLWSGEGESGSVYNFRFLTGRHALDVQGLNVIMLLMEYQQVQVSGQNVLVADLRPDEEVVFDVSITLPEVPGHHRLIALAMGLKPYDWRAAAYALPQEIFPTDLGVTISVR